MGRVRKYCSGTHESYGCARGPPAGAQPLPAGRAERVWGVNTSTLSPPAVSFLGQTRKQGNPGNGVHRSQPQGTEQGREGQRMGQGGK